MFIQIHPHLRSDRCKFYQNELQQYQEMQKQSNDDPNGVLSAQFKSPVLDRNEDQNMSQDEKQTQNDYHNQKKNYFKQSKLTQQDTKHLHNMNSYFHYNEGIQQPQLMEVQFSKVKNTCEKNMPRNKMKMNITDLQLVYIDEKDKKQLHKNNQMTRQNGQISQKAIQNKRYSLENKYNQKKYESINSQITDSYSGSMLSKNQQSIKKSRFGQNKSKFSSDNQQFVELPPRKKDKSKKQNSNIYNNKSNIKKKQSFTSLNEIVDTRKHPQNMVLIKSERQSKCINFKCKQLSIQRSLTFILIYQIVLSILGIACFVFNQYWIMSYSVSIILALPTYFGIKCVSLHKIQQNNKNRQKEGIQKNSKKIINSFYVNPLLQSKSSENINMGSIEKVNKFKIYPGGRVEPEQNIDDSSITNSIQVSSLQQNSRLSLFGFQQITYSKYLLAVPYLHQNQLQHFAKCITCNSSHSNSRIKHCKKCEVCHYGYDHFCKWLATCIDATNYSYFIKFVITLWVLSVLLIILGVYILEQSSVGFGHNYIVLGFVIFLDIQILLGCMFCTYIFGYHLWLNCRGVSTQQHFAGIKENPNNSIFCKSVNYQISKQYFDNFIEQIPYNISNESSKLNIQQVQSLTSSKFFDNKAQLENDQQSQQTQNYEKQIPKVFKSNLMKIHNIKEQQQYHQNKNNEQNTKSFSDNIAHSEHKINNNLICTIQQPIQKQSPVFIQKYNQSPKLTNRKMSENIIQQDKQQVSNINSPYKQMDSPIKLSNSNRQLFIIKNIHNQI